MSEKAQNPEHYLHLRVGSLMKQPAADLELIAPLAVRESAAAGVIREAKLLHTDDGWQMRVRIGRIDRILRLHEFHQPRFFSSVDAATRLAQKLGVRRLSVDLVNWDGARYIRATKAERVRGEKK